MSREARLEKRERKIEEREQIRRNRDAIVKALRNYNEFMNFEKHNPFTNYNENWVSYLKASGSLLKLMDNPTLTFWQRHMLRKKYKETLKKSNRLHNYYMNKR